MSKKLGQLVKDARSAAGLSQTALAQKVDGLSAADVGKIERGEKEPTQSVLRQMAKVLGVTQKSLLDAATGTSVKTSSGKTSSAKTSSGKTSSAKTSSASKSSSLTLTAAEKKLVEKYRKADAATKKAAMNVLSGDGNILEIAAALMASSGKTGSSSGSSSGGSGVNGIVTDLIGSLLSGKTGSRSAASADPDALQALQALLRQQELQ